MNVNLNGLKSYDLKEISEEVARLLRLRSSNNWLIQGQFILEPVDSCVAYYWTISFIKMKKDGSIDSVDLIKI